MTNAPAGDTNGARPDRAGTDHVRAMAPVRAGALARAVIDAVSSVVVGHDRAIGSAVAGLLAGGHVLVEDSPGVGKTLLAKALARAVGGSFGRVQGTADLLPGDLTGVTVFDPGTRAWTFRPGPLFHDVVLVDELNRATPRTQSALLEAMAEGHVTVDGTVHDLPRPFFVIATQNPRGDHGTFPLVAGQRDRFAVRVHLGIPPPDVEKALLQGRGGEHRLGQVEPVAEGGAWIAAQEAVAALHAADAVVDYVVAVAAMTRAHPAGDPELSPRASLVLLRVARAAAVLDGRDHVRPDDVKRMAPAVLGHRLAPDAGGAGDGAERVAAVLDAVPVPPAVGT